MRLSQLLHVSIEHPGDRLTLSDEIDLYPARAPDKADVIDGAIGALSQFHDEFGYHADGVGPETAALPPDWMARAGLHDFGDITAIAPEIHDLCVSKCVAGREKDAEFVRELFRAGHVHMPVLEARIRSLDGECYPLQDVVSWAARRAAEARDITP